MPPFRIYSNFGENMGTRVGGRRVSGDMGVGLGGWVREDMGWRWEKDGTAFHASHSSHLNSKYTHRITSSSTCFAFQNEFNPALQNEPVPISKYHRKSLCCQVVPSEEDLEDAVTNRPSAGCFVVSRAAPSIRKNIRVQTAKGQKSQWKLKTT